MIRTTSIVGLFVVAISAIAAITGCDKGAQTDPAANSSAAAPSAATTPATVTTGTGTVVVGAGGTAPVVAASGGAVITNGQGKTVVVSNDGGAAALNLTNERGSGSVKTDPSGGTTIKGKDGKTLNIPGLKTQ